MLCLGFRFAILVASLVSRISGVPKFEGGGVVVGGLAGSPERGWGMWWWDQVPGTVGGAASVLHLF